MREFLEKMTCTQKHANVGEIPNVQERKPVHLDDTVTPGVIVS
jgi:hypothetical protein